jgi:hypothetical protein
MLAKSTVEITWKHYQMYMPQLEHYCFPDCGICFRTSKRLEELMLFDSNILLRQSRNKRGQSLEYLEIYSRQVYSDQVDKHLDRCRTKDCRCLQMVSPSYHTAIGVPERTNIP